MAGLLAGVSVVCIAAALAGVALREAELAGVAVAAWAVAAAVVAWRAVRSRRRYRCADCGHVWMHQPP